MKHLRRYFYIVLFIPLLAGFSQANLHVGVECVQCMVSHEDQSSCCQNNAPVDHSDECSGHLAFSKIPCPHNELCQGKDTPVATTVNSAVSHHIGYGISTFSVVERPDSSRILKEVALRPPPLQVNRARYILLCSFLI